MSRSPTGASAEQRGHRARRDQSAHRPGRFHRAGRPVGLRQVHDPETRRRADPADARLCLRRGARARRRAGAHRHRVPEPHDAAVADDPRQRDAAAEDRAAVPRRVSRQEEHRVQGPRRGAAGAGRPERLRRQISLAIVRRHAAARLALPRADPRSATAAARRAVRRARPVHPRGAVGDHAGAVALAEADRDPRHARSARGRLSGQPHRRDARAPRPHHRRQRGAVRASAHDGHDLRSGVRDA